MTFIRTLVLVLSLSASAHFATKFYLQSTRVERCERQGGKAITQPDGIPLCVIQRRAAEGGERG